MADSFSPSASSASSSAMIQSLTSVDGCSMFCNDSQGMALSIQHKRSNNNDDTGGSSNDNSTSRPFVVNENVGVYSNLTKMAAQLQSPKTMPNNNGSNGHPMMVTKAPLITIETDSRTVLVKEYSGYTVGIQLPRTSNN